jgi:hypothetical protein
VALTDLDSTLNKRFEHDEHSIKRDEAAHYG